MNHIYKVVFCKATGTFVAVTEYARAQGKSGSGTVGSSVGTSGGKFGKAFAMTTLASAVGMMGMSAYAAQVDGTTVGAITGGERSDSNIRVGATSNNDATVSNTQNAVAIGGGASITRGQGDVAIGDSAKITYNDGNKATKVAVKDNKINSVIPSVAIGSHAHSNGDAGDVIIGAFAKNNFGQTVPKRLDGQDNVKSTVGQSTAIGSRAFVYGDQATAIGADTSAIGNSSIAIGGDDIDRAKPKLQEHIKEITKKSINLGRLDTVRPRLKADNFNNRALNLLNSDTAFSENDLNSVQADNYRTNNARTAAAGDASIAIGTMAQTAGTGSMALGVNALAFDTAGIAQGVLSRSIGLNATAVGSVSYADGLSTVAMGHDSQSISDTSVAVGAHSLAGTKEQSPQFSYTQKELDKAISSVSTAANHQQLIQQLDTLRNKSYIDADTKGELIRLTDQLKTGGRLATGDYNSIAAARDEVKNRLNQLSVATTSTRATALGVDANATVGGGIAVGSNANAGSVAFTVDQKAAMNKMHGKLQSVPDSQYKTKIIEVYNGLTKDEKRLVSGVINDLYALYHGGHDNRNDAQKKATALSMLKAESYNLGADNIAIGTRSQSINHDAIAIGTDSYASGKQSVVIGERATSAYNTKTKENINGSHDVRGVVVIGAGAKHLGKSVGNNHLLRGNPANPLFTEGANFVHAGLGETVATHTSDTGTKTLKFENNLLGANNTQYPTVATVVGRHAAGGGGSTVVGDTAYSAGTGVAVGSLAYVEGTSGISVGPGAYTGGNTAIAIGRQAATKQGADFATSIGAMSAATGFSSFAIGHSATSEGLGSIAIGSANFLKADSTTGTEGVQFGTKYIENGHHTQASKMHSVAFGTVAEATEHGAMAFGAYSGATKELALATGYRAQATGKYATAQGEGALASNEEAYAAGSNTHATGKQSTAVGNTAVAAQQGAIAIGSQALAGMGDKAKITDIANKEEALRTAENNLITAEKDFEAKLFAQQAADIAYKKKKILQNSEEATAEKSALDAASAVYNTAKTELENKRTAYKAAKEAFDNATKLATTVETGKNAIAIGTGAVASNDNSISIGTGNVVTGKNSGAIGDPSYITGEGTYTIGNDNGTAAAPISAKNAGAFGNQNKLTGEGSRIIGNSNEVTGKNSQVFGNNTKVGADDAVVIGNNIDTTVTGRGANEMKGSVILGNNSKPAIASTVREATVNGIKYNGFAGADNLTNGSIVSVGGDVKRQIKNVAPGEISATSTDAINGSQLYLTQDRLGNVASTAATNFGGGVTVGQDGKLTQPTYNIYKGTDTPNQAGNSNNPVTGSPANSVGDAITALNTYINQGFKVNDNAGTTKGVVTPGEAVQFADGQATKSVVATEANGVTKVQYDVQVDGTTIVIDNGKLKANTGGAPQTQNLTVANGKVNNPANADENKLTKAGNIADTINQSGFKVAQNGMAQPDLINPGDTLDFINGENTEIKLDTTRAGDTTVQVNVKSEGRLNPEGGTAAPTGKITAENPTKLVDAQTVAKAINDSGFNVIAAKTDKGTNSGTAPAKALVKTGEEVKFTAGDGIDIMQNDKEFVFKANVDGTTIKVNDEGKLEAIAQPATGGGKFKVAGNDGNTTKTVSPAANAADAPTLQVKGEGPVKTEIGGDDTAPVITVKVDKANVPVANNDGKLENPTTNPTGLVDGETLVSAINAAAHKVATADDETYIESGENQAGVAVKAGDKVTYKAGKNINVKQTGTEIAFGLNKDITVDSVTLGNTPNATKLTSTPDGDLKVGKGANGTDPAYITNVAGNLDGAKTGTATPTTAMTTPITNFDGVKNNAATVGDVLNAGFNLKQQTGTAAPVDKDFVRHADDVIFADGKATKASVVTSADGKTSTIKYDVEIDDSTLKINQDGKLYAVVPPAQGAGKFKVAGNDGTTTKTVTPSAQDNDAPTLKVEGEGPVKTTVSGTDAAPVITVSVDKAGVPDVNSTTNKGKLENPTNPTGLVDGNTLVSAVNKAGFAVNANGNPTDFGGDDKLVNAGESLNFVNGVGTTAKVTADGITFDVAKETAPTVNNNGQVNTPAVGDKFLTAKDTIDAINNSGFTVNSGATGSGVNTGNASTLVKTGEEVKFIAGNGINIAQNGKEFTIANGLEFKSGDDKTTTVTHNGNTVTITAKIPPAGTAPKQEDVGFTVSDGTNTGVVVTKKDNSPTITVKGKDKAPISTNVKVENNNPVVEIDVVKADAPTVNNANEKGKLENPTTNPTGLVDGTTLVEAVNSAGFTLAVSEDGGKLEGTSADTLITAGKKVDLAAGKNIKVKQNADGKVTFATQDDVAFDNVTVGPVIINKDTGINAGDKPITNVADGVGDKDAVNVSQLKAAKETVVAGDSNVAVDNTGTNADGGKEFKVKLNPVVTIGGAPTGGTAANNPVTINGEEGHIRGLTNTTFDPNATYNNKQAATEEQLKAAYDAVGFKLTTAAAGGTANTPTLADVKNGNTVTIKAGKGITTKQDGTSITIEASTQPANVGLGDVTVNNDGKATGNGNDADHLTSADDVADAINKAGFKVAENGTAKPDLVNAGDMVDFKDGDNTTVKVDTTPEGTVIKVNVKSDGRLTPETSTTAPANPTGKITTTTPNELVNAQTVANAINEAGFNVSSGAVNGGTNTGNASTLVKTGEEVKFIADNGVSITQAGKDFSFGVNVDDSTIKIVNGKLQAISAAPETTTLTVEAVGNVAAPSAVAPTNGVADANKFVKAGDLATTLNTTGFAIKANNADTTYGGNDKLVNAGESLNFIDGVGTKVAVSDTGITFNVNKADAPNVTNGKIDTPTAGDTFLTAKDTVDAINSAAWQLEAKADGGTVSGTPQVTNVSAGNKVELIAGKNIDINQNGKALKISAKDPKFKNSTTVTVVQDPDGTYSFNATTGAGPAPAKPSGWKVSDKDNNIENVGTVDVDAPTLKVQGKDGSPVSAKVTKEGNTPVVEIDVKTADVTVENGKVKDPEVADKGKLVTADTLKNVVNNVAHKVATKASDDEIDNDSANEAGVDIKAGDKVTYIAGKNIKVKQDGGDVAFALAKDVNLGGNGSLTLGDNANPITINKDGIKAGDKQITNIAKGADVYVTGDALVNEQPKVAGLTKFEGPNVADGNAMTVADAKNMGWVLSAADNNGQPYAEQVKNANEVNFVGSGAAKVTGATNGNKRTITVHVDPASVENTALTVADGKVTTPSTTAPTTGGIADANKYVNAGDLATTLNTIGFAVNANNNPTDFGGDDKLVNAGESLNFVNGVGTTAKVTADGITFDVAKEVAPTPNATGSITPVTNDNTFLTAKDTIDAINNSGFTVNSGATGSGVNTGNASTLVKTGEEVKFIAGDGINIAQNGKEFTIANGIEFENSNTVTVSKKGGKYVFNAIGGGTGTAPAKPSGWVVKDKAGATQDVGEVPANNAPVLQIQGKDGSPVSAKVTKEGNTPVVEIDVVKADAPTVNNANEKGKLENPTNPTGLVDGTTLVNAVNSAGFGVQVNGNDTEVGGADKLVNAGDKVNFVDGQSTTAKSNNGNITFNVNAQDVVNRSQLPVVYTKADGTKVAKADDGNFYEVKADGTPDKAKKVEAGDVIASMNTAGNQTTTPMKLANVGSSIDGQTVSGVAAPTFKQKLDAAAADNNSKNNAVNVSDLKGLADTGLNFADDNGTAINRPLGSTLNIKGGETVTGTPASKNISVTANGDTLELKLAKDINLGNEGSLTLGDNANPITINKDGIKAGDKAITNVAGNLDGAKTGTTAPTTVATKAPQDYDGVKNNAATVGDVLNAGFNLKHSNGTTITDKDFVRHADNVIFADGNATTATIDTDGTTSTIKYDVKVDNDTIKIDNGVLKATATKPETTTLNVTGGKVDAPSTTAPTTGGTAEGDKFVTAANLADTINQVGFDVAGNDGTTVQQINAGEKVSFKDGQSTTAKVTADGDNVNVSFDVNAQDVVNRSQLPVVYTKADGTKVAKADDGNFYEVKADGTPDKAKKVEAGDVIASMNTAGNQTTTPMKLANVGSSIANQAGNNFAEKLDNANTNAPNNAVNVSDLKGLADTGLNFKGDNGVTVNRPLGSVLDVKGGADVAKLTENNIGVVANAADGSLSVKLAENINLGDNGSLKIGGNNPITINKDGINAGNKQITNIAKGADVYKTGDTVHGQPIAKQPKFEGLTNLEAANAGNALTVADAKNMGWVVSAHTLDNNGNKVNPYADQVTNAREVQFIGKNGTTVKGETTADGVRTITIESVQRVIGSNSVKGKDGIKVTAADKTDSSGNVITDSSGNAVKEFTVSADTIGLTTSNGKVDTPTTLQGLVDAENIAKAINETGFVAKNGDNDNGQLIKAGDPLNLVAGKNTKVTRDGNTFTFETKDDVSFNNVKVGDVVINKDTGINAGNKKITGVQEGSDDTDAVNVKQLKDVGFKLATAADGGTATGATTVDVKNGNTVTIKAGKGITTIQNGRDVTISADISKGSVGLNGNGTVNAKNADGSNATAGNAGDVATVGDVANAVNNSFWTLSDANGTTTAPIKAGNTVKFVDGQGTKASVSYTNNEPKVTFDVATANLNVNGGKVNAPTAGNVFATATDVANAINNTGFTAKANGDSGEFIKAGDSVNFIQGDNIDITRNGSDFTVATKSDVKFSSVQLGDGPKLSNNGGNLKVGDTNGQPVRITNVAAGVDDNDVVNVSQLNAAKTKVVAGRNVDSVTYDNATNTYTVNVKDTAIVRANVGAVNAKADGTVEQNAGNQAGDAVSASSIVDAVNASGWNISGNGNNKELVNPGDQVDFVNGKGTNVSVTTAGNKTTVKVDSPMAYVNANAADESTPSDTVKMVGDNPVQVQNIASGVRPAGGGATPTGAARVKAINEATGDTLNNAVNVGDLQAVAKASVTKVTSNDGSIEVVKSQDADTGATSYDVSVATTTLDVATGSTATATGKVEAPSTANANKFVKAGDLANTLNNMGFTVKANNETAGDKVSAGDVVTFKEGDNIKVERTGTTFIIKTSDDINVKGDLNVDGDTTLGNLTVKPNAKVDMGGNAVTNIKANLVDSSNATATPNENTPANLAAKKDNAATVGDVLNAGWGLQNNGTDKDVVRHADKVNFVNGVGTTIKVETNADKTVNTIKVDSPLAYVNKDASGNITTDQSTPSNTVSLVGGDNSKPVVLQNIQSSIGDKNLVGNDFNTALTVAAQDPNKVNNAVNVGDLRKAVDVAYNVLGGNISGGSSGNTAPTVTISNVGDTIVNNPNNGTVTLTNNITNNTKVAESNGYTLTTYNVKDQKMYITNNVIEAIGRMNEQGIKFFHTNDGVVNPEVQGGNTVDSSASGAFATGIGFQANAKGENAIAMGNNAQAVGKNSISIGTGNKVTGNNSGAIGDPSIIHGESSYGVGNNNAINSQSKGVFVLGNNVKIGTGAGTDETVTTTEYNKATGQYETKTHTVKVYDGDISGAVALGDKTEVSAKGGVALGEGSVASRQAIPDNVKVEVDDPNKTKPSIAETDGIVNAVYAMSDSETARVKATVAKTKAAVSVGGNGYTRQITNVAAGSADSDAVNVSQLRSVANVVQNIGTELNGVWSGISSNAAGIAANAANIAQGVVVGDGVNTKRFGLGSPINVLGDANVTTVLGDDGLHIGLSPDINVNSITIPNQNGGAPVQITQNGLDNGGNPITNVGDGTQPHHAVNLGQLERGLGKVESGANAGTSSAMAMAALPQAYIPGKSMLTGGAATYNGQGAVAVGLSKLSDNGRWVLKVSGSADTQGNVGGSVGAGFHF